MSVVKCPTCEREAEWSVDNPWRPFCSERCKLIDLGDWASEKHAIPVTELNDETSAATPFDSLS